MYLFTDWGIKTLMIVKKADEEGTTTNADDWGIENWFWFIEQQWLKWISAGSTFVFKLHHGLPHGISWSWWNSQSAPFLTTEESQVEHLMDESFLTMFCLAISEWNDKWSTNSIYQIFQNLQCTHHFFSTFTMSAGLRAFQEVF